MASKILWCDRTWNPVIGCTRVSAGCQNCYAERMATRLAGNDKTPQYKGIAKGGKWTGKVRCLKEKLRDPLKWKKPQRVFVNSMSDLFHPEVPGGFIFDCFYNMHLAEQHTFMVLTKRPERMLNWFSEWGNGCPQNVWLGVSAEDQKSADERIPLLLQCPTKVHFVSCEPLLSRVDLIHMKVGEFNDFDALRGGSWTKTLGFVNHSTAQLPGGRSRDMGSINWVIVGGESGPGARSMAPDWARSLQYQCKEAGVAFFMKQMAHKQPIPKDLQIREFPDV